MCVEGAGNATKNTHNVEKNALFYDSTEMRKACPRSFCVPVGLNRWHSIPSAGPPCSRL